MFEMWSSVQCGNNLGLRHRYLNKLVLETVSKGSNFHDVENLPEESSVDRLFKIDVATKLKNVDYIIKTLKDDDMLYVSRALKSKWLLELRDIINPKYLEDTLFPEMVMPAITRMKHWLYINLRDPSMCQEFYCHYKENAFEFAIKFLSHCSNEFIINEVPLIVTKMSAQHLKVLSEKCPTVAKIYYDSLGTNEAVVNNYLKQEQTYFNSVKSVLKTDADVFLDITEKYFNINMFVRLSSVATNYIMSHHKHRVQNKLELYVAYILHIPTVAARLSEEECKETVVKLAQAKYLQGWFKYKVVEPLIKRLTPDKRAAFKKQVFVNKDIGELVEEWPYELPASPCYSDPSPCVFDDEEFTPFFRSSKRMLKKRKGGRYNYCEVESCIQTSKSELDQLFEEFRFAGFERALHDLRLRLRAAGTTDRRRDIFLVLISKSGGRSDAVSTLLSLAVQYKNEPAHTRASILRSLVKRANVWRLPIDVWNMLSDFGHGLGMNGNSNEIMCLEGFHAVVIRQLLAGDCDPSISKIFFDNFSSLTEYSLSVEERARIVVGLQNILIASSINETPTAAAIRLEQLFDVMKDYRIRIDSLSPIVEAVKSLALRDKESALSLLDKLYNAKVARRMLFKINLEFRRDEAALINALRHDPCALDIKVIIEILSTGEHRLDRFMTKLNIYFNQKDDLAMQLRVALINQITETHEAKFVRPLTSLLGHDFEKQLHEFDALDKNDFRFTHAAFRACIHRARPTIDIFKWGWHKVGVKATATQAFRCRELELAVIARTLAAERNTMRVALTLSMRSQLELILEIFSIAAKVRPSVAIYISLKYFRKNGDTADHRVWDIIKPLILNIDLKPREHLRRLLGNINWIPNSIRADYCMALYFAVDKCTGTESIKRRILIELSKLLPEIKDESIEIILNRMIDNTDYDGSEIPFPAIIVRYLLLATNGDDFNKRFENIGNFFLDRLDSLRLKNESSFQERFEQTIQSLKYNMAFLDSNRDSCFLVIERFIIWMQKFMPKEKYFSNYVEIHLTMLYLKAIRQTKRQIPEIFTDHKILKLDGLEAIGFTFGKYIAKEIAELVKTYFDSILEIYADALIGYLNDYFKFGSSKSKFIASIFKGLLAESEGIENRLVVYTYSSYRYDLEDSMRNEIEDLLLKINTVDFFVHAELF